MKNKIKKLFKSLLVAVVTVTSIPIITNAKTASDTLYVDYSYTYYVATTKYSDLTSWLSTGENVIRRSSDNSVVYCIQAHVHFKDGSPVVGYDSITDKLNMTNLTLEEIEKIELMAYYGYGYGNHTDLDWYAATQLLIWEITDKVSTPYPVEQGDSTLTKIDRYDSKMNEIKNLVANHGKTVSFNNQKVSLKSGETVKLEDTNKVLSKYFEVKSNDAIDLLVEENTLIIKAKKGYKGTVDLIAKDNSNQPLIYDGANQKCMSRGDPTFISGKLNVNISTEFKLKKEYGSSNDGIYKPEEKAEFELYNDTTNELITTLITDENGEASIYLGFGNYRLHQIKSKEGYKLHDDYKFIVDGKKVKESIQLQNEIIKSELVFTKTDFSTDVGLPNTLIEIYNVKNDEIIFAGRTDINGQIIIKNIEYGDYYILEREAPENYEINLEKMYFSVTEDGEVIKANMKDKRKEVEVPDTLTYDMHTVEIICLIFILVGGGTITYGIKRKNDNNKK